MHIFSSTCNSLVGGGMGGAWGRGYQCITSCSIGRVKLNTQSKPETIHTYNRRHLLTMADTLKPGSSPFSALSLSTSLLRVAILVLACDLSLLNFVSAFEFNSWKVMRVGLVRGCGRCEGVGGVRVWWCEVVGGVRVWVVWGCGNVRVHMVRWDVPEIPVLSRSAASSTQSPFLCEQPVLSGPPPAHWDLCHIATSASDESNYTEYQISSQRLSKLKPKYKRISPHLQEGT